MTCDRCQELFSDHFDAALSAGDRVAVKAHLEECEGCVAEFDVYSAGLRSLQETGQLETTGRFATDLMTSLRLEAVSSRKEEPPDVRRGILVGAIAAAVTGAFITGLMMQPDSKVVPREPEMEVPVDRGEWRKIRKETERVVINKFGLVRYGDHWISREMKEGFDRGDVCIGGRMVAPEEALLEMRAEMEEEDVSLEEKLAALGYEKTAQGFISKEWIARWKRGEVQVAPGEWRTREEFVKSRTPGEPVRRPDGAGVHNEVTDWLEGLAIGPAVAHRNVTLYPILQRGTREPVAFDTLPGNGKLVIEETGNPFEIRITNRGERDLFLVEGERIAGGRYARMVSRDVLVPAGETGSVAVLCVEPGADREETIFSGGAEAGFASIGIRRASLAGQGQGAVWCELFRQADRLEGKGLSAERREIISAFVDFPDRFPDALGVAVGVGKFICVVELFHDPEMFGRYFSRILRAAALEAALAGPTLRLSNDMEGVQALLQSPFLAHVEQRGEERILKRSGEIFGLASPAGNDLVHLLLFAPIAKPAPDVHEDRPIPSAKMNAVLDSVMTAIRSGGDFSRVRAVRSLSRFHSPGAMERLASLLESSDPVLRKFAVLCMGEGGDASVVPALVKYAGTLERHFPETERVLVALVRIGDPRALPLFLSWLDGETRRVRLVLKCLPGLILKSPEKKAWIETLDCLLACFGKAKGEIVGDLCGAIHRMTGKKFSNAEEFRAWWEDDSARETFLGERAK